MKYLKWLKGCFNSLVPKNNGRLRKRKGGRVASERQLPWVGEMTALADSCHPGTGSLVIVSHTPAGWLMAATRVADTQGAIYRKSDKKLGVVWSEGLFNFFGIFSSQF